MLPEESESTLNIEQTVSTAVASLALDSTFTFDELCQAMQNHRERKLRIVELADLGDHDGICALWLVTDSEDLVLHARSDSVLHRQQFVLHEFAHMLLGHGQGDECAVDDVLLPDIPAQTRGRLLRRQDPNSDSEIAAEAVADRLAAAIRASAFAESRYSEIFG